MELFYSSLSRIEKSLPATGNSTLRSLWDSCHTIYESNSSMEEQGSKRMVCFRRLFPEPKLEIVISTLKLDDISESTRMDLFPSSILLWFSDIPTNLWYSNTSQASLKSYHP